MPPSGPLGISALSSSTSARDRRLFAELGLAPFEGEAAFFSSCLGKVSVGQATIEVNVACAPAQFWSFVIEREGRRTKVSTGSGALSDYWPMVVAVAEDCLVVEELG